MPSFNFCSLCGAVTPVRLNNVHDHWFLFDEMGAPEKIDMCQECAEKVADFIVSLEQDFENFETVPREKIEEKED